MQFIKISNESEFVNRLFLEKLGLSTKRDNAETIGQFGSGSKFAPIAALRKGIRWISCGEDEIGPYSLEFVSVEENGINSVYCLYNESEMKPTSFTLEAGMLSWEDDFQIFREAFANALDENTEFGRKYTIELVDQVKVEPGLFSVYLSATPEMLEVYTNLEHYFKMPGDEIAIINDYYEGTAIYPSFGMDMAIYSKGVLVSDENTFDGMSPPIFNYGFNDLVLNEERRIRYPNSVYGRIGRALSYLDRWNPIHMEIARQIVNSDGMRKFELDMDADYVSGYLLSSSSPFHAIFEEKYDFDNIAVYPKSAGAEAKTAISVAGKKPVQIKSDFLYELLKQSDVPTWESCVENGPEFEFIELDGANLDMFNSALDIVRGYIPRFDSYVNSLKVYIPRGEQDRTLGVTDMNGIYISINAFSNLETVVGTLIHEWDHLRNRWAEHDDTFRGFADDHIGNLLVDNHRLKLLVGDK